MTGMILRSSLEIKKEGTFISTIIEDEEKFSQVGYKVMQSQNDGLFLKTVRVRYNGKIKLIYAAEGCRTVADIFRSEPADTIWYVLSEMINGVLQIRSNGFLGCENVELSFEHIYFDPQTEKIHFIYFPLVCGEIDNVEHYVERKISEEILDRIDKAGEIGGAQKQSMLSELGIPPYSLEEIRLCANQHLKYRKEQQHIEQSDIGKGISLVSMEKQISLRFVINGEKFTIGRRKDNDGVVDFSNLISRLHCSIVKQNGRYGVIDEESKFGTKLNSVKCIPGKFYELHMGDELEIPAITFKVQ